MQTAIDLEIDYLRILIKDLKEDSDAYKQMLTAICALEWVRNKDSRYVLSPSAYIALKHNLSIGLKPIDNGQLK
jgi:hypothetical protein